MPRHTAGTGSCPQDESNKKGSLKLLGRWRRGGREVPLMDAGGDTVRGENSFYYSTAQYDGCNWQRVYVSKEQILSIFSWKRNDKYLRQCSHQVPNRIFIHYMHKFKYYITP